MIKEFQEHHWDGFAGATCFKGGAQPLVEEHDVTGFTIIATPEHVEIFANDATQSWILDVQTPTQAVAKIFLRGLVDHLIRRTEHGFVPATDLIQNRIENLEPAHTVF